MTTGHHRTEHRDQHLDQDTGRPAYHCSPRHPCDTEGQLRVRPAGLRAAPGSGQSTPANRRKSAIVRTGSPLRSRTPCAGPQPDRWT